MAHESVRVAVYFHDDAERHRVEGALKDPVAFASVVEGETTAEGVADLTAAGAVVEVLPQSVPEAPVGASPKPTIPNEIVEELADKADLAARPDRPSESEALDEDVYRLQLRGPITREQRLEFWDLGVDIAAFEPPDRYRTFLTRDQYARVRQLPQVVDVTRYGFQDTLTPELVKLFEKEAVPGPGFAEAEPDASRRVFECLLHRERDMGRVRAVIEDAAGAEVVGTSNLRIRFTAATDVSFLSRLAAMPYVAKLAPFEAPRL